VRVIEELGSLVLVEHPEIERLRWPTQNELQSGLSKQSCADSVALYIAPHMQIVEKGSPRRIVVEHGVSKADDVAACVGADGVLIQPRRTEAGRPNLSSIRQYVAVEVSI